MNFKKKLIKKIFNKKVLLWVLLLKSGMCHAALQHTAPNNLTFVTSTAALGGTTPALYIGAGKTAFQPSTDKKLKLARIIADPSTGEVTSDSILLPFAPTKATIDTAEADHPLADASTIIAQMTTLAGQYPLLALAKYEIGKPTAPAQAGLFLVADTQTGAVLHKADNLKDYEGDDITAPAVALAAGKSWAFAAVPTKDKQFDDALDTKRSIAIIKFGGDNTATPSEDPTAPAASELKQVNADKITSADIKALAIDLGTQGAPVMAFGDGSINAIKQALVGKNACMAWDETLQRLYVGFTDVRRDDASKVGGVLAMCMVYPEKNPAGEIQKFMATPIVDTPEIGKFYTGVAQKLFETSNPTLAEGVFGVNAGTDPANFLIDALPGNLLDTSALLDGGGNVLGGNFIASGFSVNLTDIKICMAILKAAIQYCRAHAADGRGAGARGTELLTHLRDNAGIDFTPKTVDYFITDWDAGAANIGANTTAIFGSTYTDANRANAGGDRLLRNAIRTRLIELLKNAKIVNTAYAQGNEINSAYTNSLDFLIGFYADGANSRQDFDTGIAQGRNDGDDDLAVSIPHCAVMQTSTGRPYLIVHSIMSTSPFSFGGTFYTEADNWLYALPLIREGINGRDDTKGTIAKVTEGEVGSIDLTVGANPDQYQLPTTLAHMPRRYQKAVRIGGGNPIPASWVQNMFVSGDSVYVALAGVQKGLQGVFKSTALFDGKGCIINWTPATRVMGSAIQTYAAMLDPQSANFYSLTQTPTAVAGSSGPTTAQVTQWGKGKANMHGGDAKYALDTVLGGLFPSNRGGVHGIASFDDTIYGLPTKQLSMMLAYGFDSVALVKTGKSDGSAFVPITQHSLTDVGPIGNRPAVDKNVWKFNDAQVAGIGPILCGGIVHNPTNWTRFYIGGYRGLSYLEVTYPNTGGGTPDNAAFLTNINAAGNFAPGAFGGFTFNSVLAVGQAVVTRDAAGVATDSKLHALTSSGVLWQQVIGGVATGQVPLTNVTDGQVLADGTIAATGTGLQFVPAAGVAATSLNCPITQILQIEAITARDNDGLPCLPAVVYVLGMGPVKPDDVAPHADAAAPTPDADAMLPQIWRIAVTKNAAGTGADGAVLDKYQFNTTTGIKGQPRPYAQYSNLRLNFNVDGSVLFDASSKDGINNDFLRITALTAPLPNLSEFATLQASLTESLDVSRVSNFKVGVPRRDGATGAWFASGDWGLRVNE